MRDNCNNTDDARSQPKQRMNDFENSHEMEDQEDHCQINRQSRNRKRSTRKITDEDESAQKSNLRPSLRKGSHSHDPDAEGSAGDAEEADSNRNQNESNDQQEASAEKSDGK